MAKNNLTSLCTLLFLVLIFISTHKVLLVEARHLKCKKCITSSSRNMHTSSNFLKPIKGQPLIKVDGLASKKVIETLDDFRPTTPGRSPGAGHWSIDRYILLSTMLVYQLLCVWVVCPHPLVREKGEFKSCSSLKIFHPKTNCK